MSRDTSTGNNYIEIAVGLTPTNPLSYAVRYFNNAVTQNDLGVIGIFDSGDASNRSFVTTHNGGAGANVRVLTKQFSAQNIGFAGNAENDGEFNNVVVRLDTPASTDRHRLCLNGDLVNEYSATLANMHPTTASRFTMGYLRDSSPSNASDINGAEMAVWDVALTDAEVVAYAAGFSPLVIRPGNLVAYAPLVRDVRDVMGGSITDVGTVVADHGRVIYPSNPVSYFVPVAVGGDGTDMPWPEPTSPYPSKTELIPY